jgi:type I restriction enzyme S subunit
VIPTHWIKKKLGYSIETIVPMRDKPTSLQGEIPWIRIEDYNGKYIYGSKSNQGVSIDLINEMNLKVYPINTVLTTCSCSFGTTMIVKEPMTSNQTFIGLFPNKIELDEEFLYYQLHIWKDELDRISSGSIQQYLSRDNFKALRFLFPPLDEQQKIVVYLDKKTSQIDEFIQKKLQKISLLKEYRTALINQVVTKGLNPNAKLKDSGVEWIGEIPSHWISTPLKRLVKIGNGRDYKHIEVEDGGYPVFGTGGIFAKCSEFLHTGPSVLLGRKGTIDNPLFVNEPFWTSDTIYYTIIDESKIIPKLLFSLVHQIPFDLFSYGSAIPSMTKSDYQEMKFPLPSISEQNQIVEYLDKKITQIDLFIQTEEKRIELLKEYRQSIISEVVTGKTKVI